MYNSSFFNVFEVAERHQLKCAKKLSENQRKKQNKTKQKPALANKWSTSKPHVKT